MTKLTKAQRVAVKRIYDRKASETTCITYREFRRKVLPSYGCAMVLWCGMWLGIEADGYTHS